MKIKRQSGHTQYISGCLKDRLLNTIKNRFYEKVSLPNKNGCLLWKGYLKPNGYGQFSINGKSHYPHRFSYELHYGIKLNLEHEVMHTCDVRNCVAPDHLKIGTHSENMKEMNKKGRNYWTKNPVLTKKQREQVYKMIMKGCKVKDICAKYQISRTLVYSIFKKGV